MNLIFGFGEVGRSLAIYFDSIGEDYIALEEGPDGLLEKRPSQKFKRLEVKTFEEWIPGDAQVKHVFLSPGIDPRREFFKPWKDFEKREVDLFCEKFEGRVIAVTGTNAKSSIVHNIGVNLRKAIGVEKVLVGGNLGPAMMQALLEKPQAEWAVLELSSYQLERLKGARFYLSVLLNLSPDHLNRYESVDQYYQTKTEILRRGEKKLANAAISLEDSLEADDLNRFETDLSLKEIVRSVLQLLKDDFDISEVLWEGLDHRLQNLGYKNGTRWVNDSKSTNLASCLYALKQMQAHAKSIVLLVGGIDKGEDFSVILDLIRPQDQIVSFGSSADLRAKQLKLNSENVYPSLHAALSSDSLKELSVGKEMLLLSPGGSSFDEFKNFEERGAFFSTYAR